MKKARCNIISYVDILDQKKVTQYRNQTIRRKSVENKIRGQKYPFDQNVMSINKLRKARKGLKCTEKYLAFITQGTVQMMVMEELFHAKHFEFTPDFKYIPEMWCER